MDIDSQDPSIPMKTSGEAAEIIKKSINACHKFILLATNAAIESKWCNWELGYGDAKRYMEHIALLPIKPKNSIDSEFMWSEAHVNISNNCLLQ
ncbi:MAG: toll/interleukin-1 receptor domain-containing protein [Bacillus subtilis]|nr:toll/interleukin-1 receptor domain-containing protein [Bacillus subtilis]